MTVCLQTQTEHHQESGKQNQAGQERQHLSGYLQESGAGFLFFYAHRHPKTICQDALPGKGGMKMDATILETALSQGIWAALAVFLLISMMKENEKNDKRQSEREERYQNLLTELTERFEILDDVKEDVLYIRSLLAAPKDDS